MSYQRKKRVTDIIHLMQKEQELSVKDLSVLLDVSEMTIRRDLDALEEQGLINRTHGGAVLVDPNTNGDYPYILGEQITRHTREKNLIGIKAASLVQPNQTIFLDSGTTTPFLARNLNPDLPITVLCYTFTNALEFYPRKNTHLILLGGLFHRDSNIFHSTENYALIQNTRADIAFISAYGVDPEMGLTTFFDYEATIKREMIRSAKQIVLVADSTKFGHLSHNHFGDLDVVDKIITDNGLSEAYRKTLIDRGIDLIIADQEEIEQSLRSQIYES